MPDIEFLILLLLASALLAQLAGRLHVPYPVFRRLAREIDLAQSRLPPPDGEG